MPPKSSSVSAKACAIVSDEDDASGGGATSVSNNAIASHSGPRNLPPDGTTFSQINLEGSAGAELRPTLPAYGYWNAQFYQPSAGYVRYIRVKMATLRK